MARTRATETHCPYCQRDTMTDVSDSRAGKWKGFNVTRRRRRCHSCQHKYTTVELPVMYANEYRTQIKVIEDMIEVLQIQKEDLVREERLALA